MPYLLRDIYGQEFPVTAPLAIGRAPTCQIVLSDEEASRLHATVWEEPGRLILRDENSLNGTIVNGHRVRIITLQPGDQIRIGDTLLVAAAYPGLKLQEYVQPAQVQEQAPARFFKGWAHPQTLALIGGGVLLLCVLLVVGFLLLTHL